MVDPFSVRSAAIAIRANDRSAHRFRVRHRSVGCGDWGVANAVPHHGAHGDCDHRANPRALCPSYSG